MELIVRAVDVGSGNTKFVTAAAGTDIRCASFPSVAYPSSDDSPSWPASERKKTVCIPIGPLFYEVGPDVSLAADTFRAKQLHDEYTETPEYMALLRGALSMMKVSPHRPPGGGAAGGALRSQESGAGEINDRPARHRGQ
jgi:plasmid segregation protein ParM